MATEVMRQLELEFDYSDFSKGDTAELEVIAGDIDQLREDTRTQSVGAAIQLGRRMTNAKALFKAVGEETWSKWCTERLQISVSAADKAIKVFKVLGKRSVEDLAGVPASRLYSLCRDKTPAAVRNKILKRGKQYFLTERDVDQMLGEGSDQVSFGASTPTDHAELKAWFEKKAKNLGKRVGKDLAEEIPDVLREVAEELNGHE